jgi:peptide/nickel transport system permease protein
MATGFLRSLARKYTKRYLAKRLINMFVVLFAVLALNFVLPRLMPGSFVQIFVQQLEREHPGVNTAVLIQRVEGLYGLNLPYYSQFLHYVQQILSFNPNFGPSFVYYPTNAWYLVSYALTWTLVLLGTSQLISWLCGIFLGIYMAMHKDKFLDRVLQPFLYFLNTIPPFWLGLIFILVFSIDFGLLPPSGAYDVTPTLLGVVRHMILPTAVIVVVTLPSHALVVRGVTLEVLSSDFVTVTKAQGLSGRTFYGRVLRNSMLPSLTNLFLSIGFLIGGIFTVEFTFSYPGMGTLIANAIFNEDYPVIQAALYITTLVVLLSNLAADLLYPIVDPRVSYT